MHSSSAALADLLGLIGLLRNFLRHLRRTWVLVHVVDAAVEEDHVSDYRIVREAGKGFRVKEKLKQIRAAST
ncbi:unnamed protein product [Linum tenue]|uniref:Uncharacterized protein n=1 Tax=Linum tenue TaxID=586396 RepID=A0AAV0HDN3_9ROSI|nr:unnamed protein product [Linum tenue]